jgi:hypothetical protein
MHVLACVSLPTPRSSSCVADSWARGRIHSGRFLELVTLKGDVFVGANAAVLPGGAIGEGALIGAGCVVARDVPPGVFAGNLAKAIQRVSELTCPPGWYVHPSTWPPHAASAPFDLGYACHTVSQRFEPARLRGPASV